MRILLLGLALTPLLVPVACCCQKQRDAPEATETHGSCSPIVNDNKGSVTIKCSGFSDKQNKILLNFLEQLSKDQSKNQDQLLQMLDQILDSTRRIEQVVTPRVIPDDVIGETLTNYAWVPCEFMNVIVVAPPSDVESSRLATQLSGIFRAVGYRSRVIYRDLPHTGHDPDVRAVYDITGACAMDGLTQYLKKQLNFEWDFQKKSSARPLDLGGGQIGVQGDMILYVYPKSLPPQAN